MLLFDCVQRILEIFPKLGGIRDRKEWRVSVNLRARRGLRNFVMAAAICGPLLAPAQHAPGMASQRAQPGAPGSGAAVTTPTGAGNAPQSSAVISGTVLDANGSEVQGAQVVLHSLSGTETRSEQSGSNGEFTFTGLPAGSFKVVVSGRGWGTFVSPNIQLQAGDFYIVRNVVLPLTTTATVRVVANPEELAVEQVHIAEQQRVLGVIPNFYSSYDWNAPPMTPKLKFQLAFRSLTDPVSVAGVAITAGIEQKANLFSGYGTGSEGYAKRFGAAYTSDFTARMLSNAVFPSLFHQDPRYFYRGKGCFQSRALYAISRTVVTRGDNGHRQPNYSYILGTFTAGALSNLYYPPANRGGLLTFTNGLVDIAEDAGGNLLREFVLKRFTSRVRGAGSGRP
jgi:hypothetical protein